MLDQMQQLRAEPAENPVAQSCSKENRRHLRRYLYVAGTDSLTAFLWGNGWLVGHRVVLLLGQTHHLSDSLVGYPDLFLVQAHHLSDSLVKQDVHDPDVFASNSGAVKQPQEPLLTSNGVNLLCAAAQQKEAAVVGTVRHK